MASEAVANQPNIIVVMADDLGYADMSFKSDSPDDVETPGIDALRERSVFFENAYATSPICSPSRVGFMTGRYQQRWGNYWYSEGGLPSDEETIAEALKKLGYVTKKIGKVHTNGGTAEHPLDHGFDEFLGFVHHTHDYIRLSEKDAEAYEKKKKGSSSAATIGPLIRGRDEMVSYEDSYTTDIFTVEAVEYISREHSKPFYLQIEHNAVHMPTYVTFHKYGQKFGIENLKWDRNAAEWNFPYWDPDKEPWNEWHREKWGHLGAVDPQGRLRYLSHLAALDTSISRITESLKKAGIDKNTVIVFLSDNGGTINTYSNNTPLRGYKYMFGEGGIRIPMMISISGNKMPESISAVVSAMDVFPTLVELAGGRVSKHLDGKTLLPLISGKTARHHDQLFWAQGKSDTWVARKGNWKLTHHAGWIHKNFAYDEEGNAVRDDDYVYADGICLYDLKNDVSEEVNLADDRPEIVAEIMDLYKEWRSQMAPPKRL
ncbi:MAG: sulfatase-like hydrolase/transferase [Opitutales bacterium]|nr:sulfatase-like hydrolase/transferase [Opitutales bacterium]